MITVPQGVNWQLRPVATYRFLEKKHVDDFFNNGILGLSSFRKFRTHKDEVRGDKHEGMGLYLANHLPKDPSQKGHSYGSYMITGKNAYILSTTMKNDLTTFDDCDYDSGFIINDIYGFSVEVGRCIRTLIGGIIGQCVYREPAIIPIDVGEFNYHNLTAEQKQQKWIEFNQKCEQDIDIFFLKEKQYEIQQELRILWFADQTEEYELIKCPKARTFCERL